MSIFYKSSKVFATLSLIALASISQIANAQISRYDSMYFPTTQSLEGTRSAPVIYDVLNISFDAKGASKPMYFVDLKKAYAKPINAKLTLQGTIEQTLPSVGQNSENTKTDLQALHTKTLNRLNISNLEYKASVTNNTTAANNPDLFLPSTVAAQYE